MGEDRSLVLCRNPHPLAPLAYIRIRRVWQVATACNESTPRMRPASPRSWTETPHSPGPFDDCRPTPGSLLQRTSENSTSETVWKIGLASEIEVSKAAKRGRKSPDWPLFAAEEACSRGLGLFSKQFL